ncbi:MAG: hypothetical protein A2X34_05375 [Elusimicrobia bacterium GWC2_51_8]|nr:MAG: hypothetical protein A2X33_09140 [Elusimicrobia bacterium GWA2_51_34]OGR65442.1 MAG: hypothetical protein A2X34_05375 [Elusimicrobia bacterium GWC2_51_8]OGR84982.1 MAG: hypothetical protein A2021_08350 [Elusimicrobia bacterium GWF2_52_66]HAF95204.1 hypothetical protein [Elusimicrobiota bacterium]HCE97133.1 hypothetical protein [Elusimicrobiota bacterium]
MCSVTGQESEIFLHLKKQVTAIIQKAGIFIKFPANFPRAGGLSARVKPRRAAGTVNGQAIIKLDFYRTAG